MLDGALQAPVWPAGFSLRTFEPADAPDVHALLTRVFDDGADGPFEEWWARISGDAEFDPKLFFLVARRSTGGSPQWPGMDQRLRAGISPSTRAPAGSASPKR